MNSSNLFDELPAAEPPPGVVPNFVNPYTQAPLLIITGSVFVAIMIMFVSARLYAKAFVIRKATWDDCKHASKERVAISNRSDSDLYFGHVTQKGVGTHEWDLHIGALLDNNFLIPGYVFVVLQSPTLLFAKLSFYLLFYQIFKPKIAIRWAIYIGAFITTAFYFSTSICQFYFQTPGPGQTWISKIDLDPNSPESTVGIATSSFGIISDFYLLFLPMIGIWQLQMITRHKIGIMLVFATGFIACIMSILSLIYRLKSKNGSDGTYELLPPLLLGVIEESVGVSCSCMPAISAILRRHLSSFAPFARLKSYFSSLRSRSGGSSHRKPSKDSPSVSSIDSPYSAIADMELGQVARVKTYVERGRERGVAEEGIRLKQEVRQTSQKPVWPGERMNRVRGVGERREFDRGW
ncbi:hypothetical protein MMC17_004007 [Xylographa soralifera]|nr:hypothetical protein [Xylographa soralifera]